MRKLTEEEIKVLEEHLGFGIGWITNDESYETLVWRDSEAPPEFCPKTKIWKKSDTYPSCYGVEFTGIDMRWPDEMPPEERIIKLCRRN